MKESETDGKLAFLDCRVSRCNDKFVTSILERTPFRAWEQVFFYSFSCFRFKLNSISMLLYRDSKLVQTMFHALRI